MMEIVSILVLFGFSYTVNGILIFYRNKNLSWGHEQSLWTFRGSGMNRHINPTT